jgi:hypothetical protein
MPINLNAIGAKAEPQLIEWTDRNTLLYAVGVGAGTADLSFTTENSHDIAQQVLAPHRIMQTNFVPTGILHDAHRLLEGLAQRHGVRLGVEHRRIAVEYCNQQALTTMLRHHRCEIPTTGSGGPCRRAFEQGRSLNSASSSAYSLAHVGKGSQVLARREGQHALIRLSRRTAITEHG